MTDFNTAITQGVDALTISGDITAGSTFDLKGKTITNLTIDITGMANGEDLTLTNGNVTNLTVIDKLGVSFTIENVLIQNATNFN